MKCDGSASKCSIPYMVGLHVTGNVPRLNNRLCFYIPWGTILSINAYAWGEAFLKRINRNNSKRDILLK
jgi:hypothetical protein